MSKARKAKSPKPLTFEQAFVRLPEEQSRREALLATYRQAHAEYHAAHDQLASSFKTLSRATDDIAQHQATIDRLRFIVDLGPDAPIAVEKIVDAPLMTDAEFLHQKEINPDVENVGKSKALFNMDEFIGGFSRYPNREEHHEQAAARFLSLYERAQLGGAKATDYSMPFVDRSGPSEDMVLIAGEEARKSIAALRQAIDDPAFIMLERVIVGRTAARRIAAERAGSDEVTGRAVAEVAQEVKDALEAAAAHFGFRSRVRPGDRYVDEPARERRARRAVRRERNKLGA